MFGGNLPQDRAGVILPETLEVKQHEIVLRFPSLDRHSVELTG
jgi:hypothetical protein